MLKYYLISIGISIVIAILGTYQDYKRGNFHLKEFNKDHFLLIIACFIPIINNIMALFMFIGFIATISYQDTSIDKKTLEEFKHEIDLKKQWEEVYEQKKKELNIQENTLVVNCKKENSKIPKSSYYVWVDNDNLCFFSTKVLNIINYDGIKIPIKDIEYYYTRGEIYRETKITGGGGQTGGSSLKGAVIGGVVAGGAGAVIGSRKKGTIEPIKSELITHDDRETYINFFVGNQKQSIFFNISDYNTFRKIIPEKDYEVVSRKFVQNGMNNVNENNTFNITKQIKELAELKDSGILTEDEFTEKKKLLLAKIQ